MMPEPAHSVETRVAVPADAAALAALSSQLGYPASSEMLATRLTRALGRPDQAVLVACVGDQEVVGWVHGAEQEFLEAEPRCEVLGLVVDRPHRRQGAGRLLTAAIEQWAAARGLTEISVRSNILRTESHAFYQQLGYGLVKTQQIYRKRLAVPVDASLAITKPELLDGAELEGILAFLRAAERLKTITRTGWTSTGEQESVAEHSWRLCLMAMLLYGNAPGVQLARLLKMCLIHDLGEAISGDVPAPAQTPGENKAVQERADLLQLIAPLPADLRHEILDLWDEYEAAGSPEAKLAKGLDKLETLLQHTQGKNPAEFDYAFNLAYGRQYTASDPTLTALRARLDEETARRARDSLRASPHED